MLINRGPNFLIDLTGKTTILTRIQLKHRERNFRETYVTVICQEFAVFLFSSFKRVLSAYFQLDCMYNFNEFNCVHCELFYKAIIYLWQSLKKKSLDRNDASASRIYISWLSVSPLVAFAISMHCLLFMTVPILSSR